MSNENYAFAVANIRSQEKKLIQKNQLERLIDAPNASAFFESLNETAYAKHFTETKNPEDYSVILAKTMLETKNLLTKICPYKENLNWLWLKYDFLNIKFAIKNYLTKNQLKLEDFNNLGEIKPEKIIQKSIKKFEKEKNPSQIDEILDQEYFVCLSSEINKTNSRQIKNLIKAKIDLNNLKLLIRYKYLKKTINEFEKNICKGGTISTKDLKNAFDSNFEDIQKNAKFIDYDLILKAGIKYLIEEKSYLIFEKLSYEYFLEKLRFAKYEAFGVEPLIAFWLAKDNETNIIQIIMIGKLNNIEPKIIHQQLHKLYTEK